MIHEKNRVVGGTALSDASYALVLVHGRGGSAQDILTLAGHFHIPGFACIAPQATGNTWYPYSFMAPVAQNEPALSSAIRVLEEVVEEIKAAGIPNENIFFAGFSQGACLTLEFIARQAARYGGVAAFTGGLIGVHIDRAGYQGRFDGMPVFIGSADPDPHVPAERVMATAAILEKMGADVHVKIYPGMGHTISADEIREVNEKIFAATGNEKK